MSQMQMQRPAMAALLLAALALPASSQQMKAENQVKYRRAAYQLMNLNFGSLEAMVENKKPFNHDEAARNAEFVAMLATVPKAFFGEGTDKDTRAKPEIWKNRADFDSKMDKMASEAAKLPAVVKAGDMGAFRKQVHDVGEACKACHDEYRAKQQ
jgi:cytochrome c556